MEERLAALEKDLALMAQTQKTMSESLNEISHTLKHLLELQTQTKLLDQRMDNIDSQVREAFQRTFKRIERTENNITWVVRTIIGAMLSGAVAFVYWLLKQ